MVPKNRAALIPVIVAAVTASATLSACGAQRDPRMALLDTRADAILAKYQSPGDIPQSSDDVSAAMCPGINKMWLPAVAGDIGDVYFQNVPGKVTINGDTPDQYLIVAGAKTIGLGSVRLNVEFNPVTNECHAEVIGSGP